MDNEMLALYKEANRKWNEKEHLMRNVLRYKDGESKQNSYLARRSIWLHHPIAGS